MTRVTLFLITVLLLGCAADDSNSGPPGCDECVPEPAPQECQIQSPAEGFVYPAGPYGDGGLNEVFEDFEMIDVDGNTVRFADVLASSELVLLNVGAGWCQPCIEETLTMNAEIFRPFCGRGLRVVQVLFQDEDGGAATKFDSTRWRNLYALQFPVLVDRLFESRRYLDASQTPLNLLIDRDGVVRFRSTGTVPADLAARIDEMLP